MNQKELKFIDEHDPILSVSQTAEYLGSSSSTLAKQRMRGDGPEYIKLGNRIRYRKSALDLYVDHNTYRNTGQY